MDYLARNSTILFLGCLIVRPLTSVSSSNFQLAMKLITSLRGAVLPRRSTFGLRYLLPTHILFLKLNTSLRGVSGLEGGMIETPPNNNKHNTDPSDAGRTLCAACTISQGTIHGCWCGDATQPGAASRFNICFWVHDGRMNEAPPLATEW
ncbi:hypothetical protein K402DRAFT_406088 [Aulographum hederae CBS 113979]|uniref:Secreted protein n=1 Tax=Aulographum hederae CBS 113979 TaxID=1176131 RepID=A0A6G1GUE1_9PEZI|nr:hypothetical protein K402DRAFT_406088 [Aulographum hederae CBS 113979]